MRGTAMQTTAAAWRRVPWMGLCLFLFVAACAPTPSSVTPTATGSVQAATITAYHGHTSTIFAVAWSPDGTRIASGGNDNTVQVWDARTGRRLVMYTGHTGIVYTLAWSPDGTRIASGSDDSTVQVWDLKERRDLPPLHRMSCSRPLSHASKGNGLEQQLWQGLKTLYHTEGTRNLRSPS